MGLVTDDLSEWLAEPKPVLEAKTFGAGLAPAARERPQAGWGHAVYRLRKWLRTTLAPHGEHGDGFTR